MYNKMKELAEKQNNAWWKLRRASAIGAFVISPKATEALKELLARSDPDWDGNPPWDVYEAEYLAFKKTLDVIRDIAMNDLKATDN